jgi:maleate isomerase
MTTVGLIVPSSNVMIERTLAQGRVGALMGADTVVTRMPVVDISGTRASRLQFTFDAMREAALLLKDAHPDVIAWTGTSGFWLGLNEERALLLSLTALVSCPVVSAAQGVVEALRLTGASEIGLLTPYVEEVHREVLATIETLGFNVVAETCLEVLENFKFSLIGEGRIETELSQLALRTQGFQQTPLAIICTNLPIAVEYEGTVVDSLVAALWFAAVKSDCSNETYGQFHARLLAQLRRSRAARPAPLR